MEQLIVSLSTPDDVLPVSVMETIWRVHEPSPKRVPFVPGARKTLWEQTKDNCLGTNKRQLFRKGSRLYEHEPSSNNAQSKAAACKT
jgi:hypothetical protein